MSAPLTLLGGAALGMAAGSLLVPLTRRELAASVARSSVPGAAPVTTAEAAPRVGTGHWIALAAASGLLPAYVLHRVGWSIIALPPLLLLVGLVQLAYCDLTRRLLPKTLVYALSAAVIVSGVVDRRRHARMAAAARRHARRARLLRALLRHQPR